MIRLLKALLVSMMLGALVAIVSWLLGYNAPTWAAITWAAVSILQGCINYNLLRTIGLNERTIATQRESNDKLWALLEREDNDANRR